ncbi:MAG: transposase, partial [Devosia sp.]
MLIFKALVLRTLYDLSGRPGGYQLRGRLAFMRFLELGLEDAVPAGAGRSKRCSICLTPTCKSTAIWPWMGKSSMRRSCRRPGSAAGARTVTRSNPAGRRRSG